MSCPLQLLQVSLALVYCVVLLQWCCCYQLPSLYCCRYQSTVLKVVDDPFLSFLNLIRVVPPHRFTDAPSLCSSS